MKYDVIVVGSGLGGLTCASHLSVLGYKVAVFEQHFLAGGYATNFKRRGYEFDVSLHGIGGLEPGGNVYHILQACQVIDKITPLKNELAYQVEWQGELIEIPNDLVKYEGLLINSFKKNEAGIKKLFKAIKRFENGFNKFILESDKRLWNKIHPDVALFMSWSSKTTDEVIRKYVNDDEFIRFFTALWSYYGLPPKQLSAIYFFIPWVSYHHHGKFYIEGGGGELSKAFVDVIKEYGGDVFLRAEVTEITMNKQQVCGIKLKDGTQYKADFIVANCNPITLTNLLPNEAIDSKEIKNHQIGCTLTQLYLGLDCHPEVLNIPNDEVFYLGGESHEQDYQLALKQQFDRCGFLLTNYNSMDPSLNASDKGVLTVTYLDCYEAWPSDQTLYKLKKEEITELVLLRLEKLYPGIKEHIVVQELGTPKTMERYTKNYKGAVYGYAQTTKQSGRYRLKNKTNIPNLFISNAWNNPGGGYEGVISSGIMTARQIYRIKNG